MEHFHQLPTVYVVSHKGLYSHSTYKYMHVNDLESSIPDDLVVDTTKYADDCAEDRAVARTLIGGGGGGGCIFIYSGSARLTSFEINFISKETSRAEPEYMNIHPPPISALATALAEDQLVEQDMSSSMRVAIDCVFKWAETNKIELNKKKCGHATLISFKNHVQYKLR